MRSSSIPGRASNEAAWLFQLFAREYGTNNFPDCSNMCHESTSVGLPQSIGIGKGTVSLDDFDQTELVISIGHNPGTNHPRMMGTLHELARRGVPIIVFNPLRERALERFADPQNVMEMATRRSTPIASTYYQVRAGGDAAALKGSPKRCCSWRRSRAMCSTTRLLPSIPRDSLPSPRICMPPAGRISNRSPA
jgi:anaerobic selenocysteine-containing dehydrogenase